MGGRGVVMVKSTSRKFSGTGVVRTSICCTVRSRKVSSFLTEMTDLGPVQPIVVPRPPFSFNTTNLLSADRITSFCKSDSVVNSL